MARFSRYFLNSPRTCTSEWSRKAGENIDISYGIKKVDRYFSPVALVRLENMVIGLDNLDIVLLRLRRFYAVHKEAMRRRQHERWR